MGLDLGWSSRTPFIFGIGSASLEAFLDSRAWNCEGLAPVSSPQVDGGARGGE